MQTVFIKASQAKSTKRDLLLVDEEASVIVTLWGQQVEIIVIKVIGLVSFPRRKNLMVHQIQLLL